MIVKIGLNALLLHLAAAASFRGATTTSNNINSNPRNLQDSACYTHTKKNLCPEGPNDPCLWQAQDRQCIDRPAEPTNTPTLKPTNAPTDGPTSQPTSPPSHQPTDSPTVPGMGYCSDNPSTPCWSMTDCSCGGGGASVPADESSPENNLFGRRSSFRSNRRRLQTSCPDATGSKRSDCPISATTCDWVGGQCVSTVVVTDPPTNEPTAGQPQPTDPPSNTPSSSPSKSPKNKPTASPVPPTPCACLGLGTTKSPTPEPTNVPTKGPSFAPSNVPTKSLTDMPSNSPITPQPTNVPTKEPTSDPIKRPTDAPTNDPTEEPTDAPTKKPTLAPTNNPTEEPTDAPTKVSTNAPTTSPIASSLYGNGPFVALATSSEVVTIPRPPVPSSDPRTNCPHEQSGLLSWHDDATWAGSHGYVPLAGEDVTLPDSTKVVILQSIAVELGVITVPSTSELIFDENGVAPITIDVAGMDVQGSLRAGSETCRYNTELTITLHGSRPTDLNIYGVSNTAIKTYKGISVNGGIISMHGKRHYPTWSRLAEYVPVGQSYLLVQEEVNWEAGQEIVLTTTAIHDSRDWHQNEVLTISSIVNSPVPGVGSAIHFTTPTAHSHIANTGYQAEIGLLTRNIKVQGAADDSEPTDPDTGSCTGDWHFGTNFQPCPNTYKTGFGGHIIVHSGGKGYMEGVELHRMGQTNVLGRYPFHWHLLGSCNDCYFKENSINKSYYRCVSIHGTHNATVSENVAYDVSGYCYYLEDGVEEDNTISFNLAAHIHPVSNIVANAGGGQVITPFSQSQDLILPADVTASGYYLTNLANHIIGNAASGGWAGYSLPILQTPIGANKGVNMRPGNRLTKTFDGNTAHSTGWWWSHAGAFYSGGSLYYSDSDPTLLEYNAGRDQSKGYRSPCLVDKCVTASDCNSYCYEGERAWFQLTNNKVFLTASPGLNSWSGRMEILGFEAHDVSLGLEAIEAGFGIDNLLVECRSGEEWVMPGNPFDVKADGFFWYDTGQEHIITNAKFRNCGARTGDNVYDSSPTRGCDTNSFNGCSQGSTVWGFLTHSDQFTPEVMQATSGITYEDCGRRFKLEDYANQNAISSVSGRNQNWRDVDGTASGLNEPTIIGSGLTDAGHWWRVEDDVIEDPEGPLTFIKANNGAERGLGHIRFWFKDAVHNAVGQTSCFNGPKSDGAGNLYCPTIGRIRHLGSLFDSSNDPTGGLPITANAEVAGPVGGYGWVLQLDDGPPKNLKIDQVEVDSSTPLMLAIPYPAGTSFSITAHAAYCSTTCTENFSAVNSVAHVRFSQGNTYFYDATTQLLYVRIIQTPQSYTGDPDWHLWTLDDPMTISWDPRTHALDRFAFNGITLPSGAYGPYFQIAADCTEGSVSGHCGTIPVYVEPQVCPSGYIQVSYDKCCVSVGSNDCYDPTAPPTTSPTPSPTFGQSSNLVLNPDFENGLTSWYANSGTIQSEFTETHSGSQSVLCKDRTQTWMGVQQTMTGRLQANKTYHVSCWAKLRNAASANLGLTLQINDDIGPKWTGVWNTINDSSWTLVEGNLFVEVSGTLSAVTFFAEGPGAGVEYYVDDCSAVLVP